MSAKYFELIVEPRDGESDYRIPQFVALVKKRRFVELHELMGDLWQQGADELEREFIDMLKTRKGDGVIEIEFQTSTLSDNEAFRTLLDGLGARKFEMRIFNSQVGEYTFINQDGIYYNYKEAKWHWLKNPEPDFGGEVVAVTGDFADYDEDDIRDIVVDYGGTFGASVDSNTTMLIVGKKPDKTETTSAKELGITCLSEKQFDKVLEGS